MYQADRGDIDSRLRFGPHSSGSSHRWFCIWTGVPRASGLDLGDPEDVRNVVELETAIPTDFHTVTGSVTS